jgi:hypothetical protein
VFFLGTGLAASCKFLQNGNTVHCEAAISRVSTPQDSPQPKFDWAKFWELLKPQWFRLLIAITVSSITFPKEKPNPKSKLFFSECFYCCHFKY